MEVDIETIPSGEDIKAEEMACDPIYDIIDYLVRNDDICFKSQQIGEVDLKINDKKKIATDIFNKGKLPFLERFGKHLKYEHLAYFENNKNPPDNDITYHIAQLKLFLSDDGRKFGVKNRRFEALSKMVENTSYFSETEMMQRNPVLYEHLVGQYMSEDEKKARDNIDTDNISLLNVILEGLDRRRNKSIIQENTATENNESNDNSADDSEDEFKNTTTFSSWGEFATDDNKKEKKRKKIKKDSFITAPERDLLKEEFVQEMYRSFLDGEDKDVDYRDIDNNTDYDCIEVRGRDEEEKYFDLESPEDSASQDNIINQTIESKSESNADDSEDELDIYMKNLNRHSTLRNVTQVMDEN